MLNKMKGGVQMCKMWRLCVLSVTDRVLAVGTPCCCQVVGKHWAFSLPSQSVGHFETSANTNPTSPRRTPEHPIPRVSN